MFMLLYCQRFAADTAASTVCEIVTESATFGARWIEISELDVSSKDWSRDAPVPLLEGEPSPRRGY